MLNKSKCERCKRILRTKHLSKNKVTEQMLCLRCNNRIGQNKFYIPKIESRNNFINNYSITDTEKRVLSKSKSYKDINKLCNGLKNIRKKARELKKVNKINEKVKSNKNIEMHKKFLEGLK